MNITVLQDSFNRGELSPRAYMRSNTEFYLDATRTLRNFLPVPRGAVKRRSGFRYLNRVALPDTTQNVFPDTATIVISTPGVDVG